MLFHSGARIVRDASQTYRQRQTWRIKKRPESRGFRAINMRNIPQSENKGYQKSHTFALRRVRHLMKTVVCQGLQYKR
jgi:hypothetical protein